MTEKRTIVIDYVDHDGITSISYAVVPMLAYVPELRRAELMTLVVEPAPSCEDKQLLIYVLREILEQERGI